MAESRIVIASADVLDNVELSPSRRFWSDISTPTTWSVHLSNGTPSRRRCHFSKKFQVTGGDILVHYVSKPAWRFVGISEIIDGEFHDGSRNPHNDPKLRWYLDTHPIIEKDVLHGVSWYALLAKLSFGTERSRGRFVRGSGTEWCWRDAEVVRIAL